MDSSKKVFYDLDNLEQVLGEDDDFFRDLGDDTQMAPSPREVELHESPIAPLKDLFNEGSYIFEQAPPAQDRDCGSNLQTQGRENHLAAPFASWAPADAGSYPHNGQAPQYSAPKIDSEYFDDAFSSFCMEFNPSMQANEGSSRSQYAPWHGVNAATTDSWSDGSSDAFGNRSLDYSENFVAATPTASWVDFSGQALPPTSGARDFQDLTSSSVSMSGAQTSTDVLNSMAPMSGSVLRTNQVAQQSTGSTDQALPCKRCPICDDPAKKKHYGVVCCDGCKGFFRRSIRYQRDFKCPLSKNCNLKKSEAGGKSLCRHCRLRRCLEVGMNPGAVQPERDPIGPRKNKENQPANGRAPLGHNAITSSSILPKSAIDASGRTAATLVDLYLSVDQSTERISDWARNLPNFPALRDEDRKKLAEDHRVTHLLFEIIARSLPQSSEPRLLMGERLFISEDQASPTMQLGQKIHKDLLEPMRKLQLDEMEFVLLKSILFWDTSSLHIFDMGRVSAAQTDLYIALGEHVRGKGFPNGDRLRQISQMVVAFSSMAYEVSELLLRSPTIQIAPLPIR
ncbi:hepatocyte nuclear factor 4-gamma-like [Galendromus occidentalis]|uniref:Hepatocyte nuclear factor 4-gamma-like n=1 Tax=Galendromus occidentalis TaxID=34638 RepID=A0AAJ7P9R7_9ACAR|nr:hepatocyte nuclear factor 4-gamma-like [Galendromus occidentalis]